MINLDSATEPPLSGKLKVAASMAIHFFSLLFWRAVEYVTVCANLVWSTVTAGNNLLTRFKKFMVRLLMYRGGYFYHTHRFGLATVASTAMLSVMFLPVLDPLMDKFSATSVILADVNQEVETSESLVLGIAPRSYQTSEPTKETMTNEVVQYQVKPGDTISSIAEQNLVSAEALNYVNNLTSSSFIHPGDTLKIPPVGGLIHKVKEDETISSIATLYEVSPQTIVDFNHIEEPYVIHSGDDLVVPDAKIPALKPKSAPVTPNTSNLAGLRIENIAPAAGSGAIGMPVNGTITQYFWWGHTALDIAAACGTPIVAPDSGTITFAGWWAGGGGNSIFIDHGNGYMTQMAHMSGFARTGGTVNKGDVIGYVGATGRAYGCHVHFIVQNGGRPINPMTVL